MNFVIYRTILQDGKLTPEEKIVYSYLVYRSIGKATFMANGDVDSLTEMSKYSGTYIPIWEEDKVRTAANLSISLRNIHYIFHRLMDYGYIKGDSVLIPNNIQSGYFDMHYLRGLNTVCGIVHSYLIDKSSKYNPIDTYHQKMAQELGMSVSQLSQNLTKLSKNGLIATVRQGKRKLIRVLPREVKAEVVPSPAIVTTSPDIRPEPVMMFPRYISPIEELQMRAARGQDVHI